MDDAVAKRMAEFEQRMDDLESRVGDVIQDIGTLAGVVNRLSGKDASNKKNCRHCGRLMQVVPGAACPVCGKA